MNIAATLPAEPSTHWQQPLGFALVGLGMGLLIRGLDGFLINSVSTAWIGLHTTLPFTLVVFLPVALLLWSSQRRVFIPIYLISMLALALWTGWNAQTTPDWQGHIVASLNFMSVVFYCLLVVVTMISLSFVQAWQKDRPHYTYPRLFATAWDNVHTLVLALFFSLVVFLLAMTAAALFDMVTINKDLVFEGSDHPLLELIQANYEIIFLTALSAGIGVIQQYSPILLRLYVLAFALYRMLAYLLAFIIIGFAVIIIPNLQQFFTDKGSTAIFLGLVISSIILLNTLLDRGSTTLPAWAHFLFGAQILILPVLTALTAYGLVSRIQAEGLTPSTMLGLMLSLLLLAYTATYALQWLRLRRNWSEGFKTVNPPLALLTALLGMLVLTPVLDPQAWSARDQLARLQAGKITALQIDYISLYNRWGKPGLNTLDTLQTWKDHPEYATINEEIARVKEQGSATAFKTDEVLTKIQVIPADRTVDLKAFIERSQAIEPSEFRFALNECHNSVSPTTGCRLIFQDVNADSKEEALLLAFISQDKTTENGKTSTQYAIDGRLYLLDDQGLPLRVKLLSNAHLQPTMGANRLDYSKNPTYPVLDKAAFDQAKAAAEARQLTPMLPTLPDLKIGGQLLQDQN